MQYRSKPHTIKGFQLGQNCVTPDWFEEAKIRGEVQTINNGKERHVTIYDKKGGVRHAYHDDKDWVCLNLSGTIFPMTNEEFNRGFEPDDVC